MSNLKGNLILELQSLNRGVSNILRLHQKNTFENHITRTILVLDRLIDTTIAVFKMTKQCHFILCLEISI